MAITMQGNWTIRVKSKDAAFAQRFQISGAAAGNGTYAGDVTTPAVFVTGGQWSINIQNRPTGGAWQDSLQRITYPSAAGGLVHFDIRSNDAGSDADYNDLILTCSMPVSASEFVLYGRAKTYAGPCVFNPCSDWYYIIDTPAALARALELADLRKIIEKLYPERVRLRVPPIPLPDPPPDFRPLILPRGQVGQASGVEFRSKAVLVDSLPAGAEQNARFAVALPRVLDAAAGTASAGTASAGTASAGTASAGTAGAGTASAGTASALDPLKTQAAAVAALQASARPVSYHAAALSLAGETLSKAEKFVLASAADRYKSIFACDSEAAPGLLLNFQEYDRTDAEKLGGPYTGAGPRENLGVAATDELGNYIFRFSRSLADLASEALDAASGEALASAIRPDVIVQVLGAGMEVDFETAPHFNIPNLVRIDLCIPREKVHPSHPCGGDRVIQRVGDVIVLHSALGGHPNTLDADGRITCRNANAPAVDCAAWRGSLRLYGCLGKSAASYTVRYKRAGLDADYQFVGEQFKLNHIPDFAPGYSGTLVGPTLRSVHVDGGAAQACPTYDNHEGDTNWIENDLKIILNSYLYRPGEQPGPVDIKIQGYTAAGALVPGTDDTLRLYIHNQYYLSGRPNNSKGDIASISMGAESLGDCALFNLSAPGAPLTVRYRSVDPSGFVAAWSLAVTRGNNNPVSVSVASGAAPKSSTAAASPCSFHGTRDEVSADLDDYVLTALQPTGGSWLPEGVTFCAFAFTLSATDRVTDGRSGYPQVVYWQDLIGLTYP